MKKKFINGLLMIALFVGFTSSVVSCKDYDDEKLGEIDGRLTYLDKTLRQELADQKSDLEKLIKALETDLKDCKTTCEAFRTATDEKFKLYVTLEKLNDVLKDYYKKSETYNRTEIEALITSEINKALGDYYTKAQIDAMLPDFSTFATKTELQTAVSTLEGKITDLKNSIDEELKQYVKASALEQTVADMLSNAEGILYKALETYFTNNAAISAFIDGKIDAKLETINTAITNINTTIGQVQEAVKTAQSRADAAYTLAEQANTAAGNAQATADDALKLAKENKTNLETLSGEFNQLVSRVNILETNLATVTETANNAWAQATANAQDIDNLEDAYAALSEKLDAVDADVTGLKTDVKDALDDIVALKEEVAANKAEADALHAEMLETISGLVSAIAENQEKIAQNTQDIATNASNISTLTTTVGELAEDIETVKNQLNEKVADLQGKIDTANGNIAANTEAIGELTGILKNVVAKWITGIELNGTYNPMFGELNLPVDVRSNMLVAFHGELGDNGIEFPTRNSDYYQQETEQWKKFTAEDEAMLGGLSKIEMGGNTTIINLNDEGTEEGNAGTLYLTVNPTNRDFTGTEFKLIDSNDNESPVKIEPLKKSDHTLWFGYTRSGVADGAQSSNGFYEAKVTFSEAALQSNNRLRVDVEKLKNVVEDLKDYENGFDLHNLTEAVYFNINEFLIANAVKATWTDELGTRSVVSQYGIGATSIKPLSFAWGKDLGTLDFGLGLAEDFIDRLIDKAAAGFPELRFIDYTIDDIAFEKFEDLDGDGEVNPNAIVAQFNVKVTSLYLWEAGPKTVWVNVPTWHAYDNNGKIHTIHPADVRVKIEIVPDPEYAGRVNLVVSYDISEELQRLANYYYDKDKDVEKEQIRKQINMYLDDIRDFLNDLKDIKASKIADKAKNAISDYFNTIYKRYKRYLNPNKYVQPTLLVKTNDSYRRLSRSAKVPAQIKGTSLLLVPTTYTAEIISPAYKKFVAVTNVFKGEASAQGGDAACKSVLDKANAQSRINEVINGGWGSFIEFEAENGYTYEVLYSAVDYTGLVFTEKYYFTVSK